MYLFTQSISVDENIYIMRQIIHVVILLFIIPCSVYSQSVPDIEKLLETNDIESSEDYYEDINSLIHLSVQPINLNSAGFDSLKMLFFLSDAQIDNLLDFRKKHGAFTHPNELLLITGISQQDLSNIKPSERTHPKSNPVITFRKKSSLA